MTIDIKEAAKSIALAHPLEAAEVARHLRLAIKSASLIANCTTGAVADDVRKSVEHVLQIADALDPPAGFDVISGIEQSPTFVPKRARLGKCGNGCTFWVNGKQYAEGDVVETGDVIEFRFGDSK